MKVFLFVPSIGGKPWKPGAAITVNSGTWRRYSSSDSGRMNMFLTKRLCHAVSVMIRSENGGTLWFPGAG